MNLGNSGYFQLQNFVIEKVVFRVRYDRSILFGRIWLNWDFNHVLISSGLFLVPL